MPEAQCIKYPVKPGHRETLVNWIARLEDRSTELVEAMAEGGFVAEAVFLERSDSGDHILIYTSAQDLQAGSEALSNSKLPLVQEFNQLLAESVDMEKAVSLELIYHTP
jgi:Family of unknown function (DUF6176)